MNIEITSLNPFKVSFRLYNLLGEIDGHPKVVFDMSTGEFALTHDKGFANLVSMSEHHLKGQPLVLAPDSPMWPAVRKQVARRIQSTGFHEEWATVEFNKHYQGNPKYPSYYFTMWIWDEAVEISSYRGIGSDEYAQLWEWSYHQAGARMSALVLEGRKGDKRPAVDAVLMRVTESCEQNGDLQALMDGKDHENRDIRIRRMNEISDEIEAIIGPLKKS